MLTDLQCAKLCNIDSKNGVFYEQWSQAATHLNLYESLPTWISNQLKVTSSLDKGLF